MTVQPGTITGKKIKYLCVMRMILFILFLGVFFPMATAQILTVETLTGDTTFNLFAEATDEPDELDSTLLFNQVVSIVEGQFRRSANQLSQSDFLQNQAIKNGQLFNATFPDTSYFDFTRAKYKDRFLGDWRTSLEGSGVITQMEMVELPNGTIRFREKQNPANFGTVFWYAANQIEIRNYYEDGGVPINAIFTIRVGS